MTALGMITEDDGIEAPIDVVQRIVRSFWYPMWHFPVGNLIGRYLTLTQVVEALMHGITNPTYSDALESLTGFRLYLGRLRLRTDSENGCDSQQCLRNFRSWSADDPEIAGLAQNARRALENHSSSILSE